MPVVSPARSKSLNKETKSLRCGSRQVCADFVAEVVEEIGVGRRSAFLNVVAALCGRSLQSERRL
jgi:hypothetical protein